MALIVGIGSNLQKSINEASTESRRLRFKRHYKGVVGDVIVARHRKKRTIEY